VAATKRSGSPRELLAEAERHRERALELEGEAIRAALESADWLVAPAAQHLGLPRYTTLVRWLERHPDIQDELRRRRAERGYTKGNPAPMRSK
jgi:transcriptional regulator of acetoin/glycerol metabolism